MSTALPLCQEYNTFITEFFLFSRLDLWIKLEIGCTLPNFAFQYQIYRPLHAKIDLGCRRYWGRVFSVFPGLTFYAQ